MKKSLVFAFTLTGTFIGAGFATGREIFVFFISKSPAGIYFYTASCLLISLVCFLAFEAAKKSGTVKADDFYGEIFGPGRGKAFFALSLFSLFAGYGASVGGMGALFSERLSMPYAAGASLMFFSALGISFAGIKGIYALNLFLTQVMIAIMMMTGAAASADLAVFAAEGCFSGVAVRAPLFALMYCGYNIISLVPVSMAEAGRLDAKTVFHGAALSFAISAAAGAAVFAALEKNTDIAYGYVLPLPAIAASLPEFYEKSYTAVMCFSLITTGSSCLFGFIEGIKGYFGSKKRIIIPLCVSGTVLFAMTGFSGIVGAVYPATGVFGLIIISGIIKKHNKYRH